MSGKNMSMYKEQFKFKNTAAKRLHEDYFIFSIFTTEMIFVDNFYISSSLLSWCILSFRS